MTQHAPPVACAGHQLGGRYLLEHELPHAIDAPTTVWRAEDLVLARPVAIRMLCEPVDLTGQNATPRSFTAAAMRSGRVTHPAVAAVFDAGVENRTDADSGIAYAVVRWIDAVPLQEILRGGPLEQDRALRLLISACDAVSALHEAGITHDRLHPGNLMIDTDDSVTLTDAVLAATVHGDSTPPGEDPIAADTRALGWLLHCALTGYWPGPPRWAPTLAPVPVDDRGAPAGPRQLRAGITRELDAVVIRATDRPPHTKGPPLRSPTELRTALIALVTPGRSPSSGGKAGQGKGSDTTPWWRTRKGRWSVRIGSLVVLAGLGWVIGYLVGKVPNPPGSGTKPTVVSSPSTTGLSGAITPASVSAFDPLGDRSEDDSRVPLATDGDPTTGWLTETYQGGPKLGGKAGVGLLVDLGSVRAIKSVNLTLSEGGTDVELRAADPGASTAPTTDSAFRTVATQADAAGANVSLVPSASTTSRYWLVWLTSLPPVANGYQGAIMEMTFLPTTTPAGTP